MERSAVDDYEKRSSWTVTLLLAIGIHNLILPLRVGVTAALMPAVASAFRRRGLDKLIIKLFKSPSSSK
jgi:hypothetical protein